MIRQSGRHRGRPILLLPVGVFHPQSPNAPAEVVAVHRQVRHRLVDPPILAEAVSLPGFSRIPAAIGTVLPLKKRRINAAARGRPGQRLAQPFGRTEYQPLFHRDHAITLANFVDRRVVQFLRQTTPGENPRASRLPLRWFLLRLTEGGLDRVLVGRQFVGGDEVRDVAAEPPLDVGDDRFGVLHSPGSDDHRQDESAFGVKGDEVPCVAAVGVVGIVRVAILLLLADERPFLIDLDLAGLGGKSPRVRRGRAGRDGRPGGPAL